jgi:DNA polymerase-1
MGAKTPRTLLIDADIFAFAGASATEGVYHFHGADAPPAIDPNLDEAIEVAQSKIEEVAKKLRATRLIVCLTDERNFRTDVCPAYKGNRADKRRPSTLAAVKDFFAGRYETYKRPGLEADDCMGILSTHKSLIPGEKIIVSSDKDMQTIPGLLFNPAKDKEVRRISRLDADRFFMRQTLTGDPTDGYPGCPGIGPKSKFVAAVMASSSLAEAWGHVLAGYASKGRTAADALVQARQARILRAEDWDFERKAPRLWSPPAAAAN